MGHPGPEQKPIADPLAQVARIWEGHARADPLWAILSQEDKSGRRWNAEEFFATGRSEVASLFSQLEGFGLVPGHGRALDFGCGVGRITHALAGHFDAVVGVDISPTMIGLANQLNPDRKRIRFLLNQASDLAQLESGQFDLVFTLITLQHIPPAVSLRYLAEFLRLLKPGGVLAFQLPSEARAEARAVEPLPDEAYRATITVLDAPSVVAPSTRFPVRLAVRNASGVEWHPLEAPKLAPDTDWMAGDGTWKRSKVGQLDVGNHWLNESGAIVIRDDGRVSLPLRLGPGDEAVVELTATSPERTGRYYLEVDLVQERVCWFHSKGSPTCRFPLDVRAPAGFGHRIRLLATAFQARGRRGPWTRSGRDKRQAATVTAARWNQVLERLQPEEQPEPYAMHAIAKADVERFLQEHGGQVVGAVESVAAGWPWVSYTYYVRRA